MYSINRIFGMRCESVGCIYSYLYNPLAIVDGMLEIISLILKCDWICKNVHIHKNINIKKFNFDLFNSLYLKNA